MDRHGNLKKSEARGAPLVRALIACTLLGVPFLAACAEETTQDGFLVRDSAGVRIVEDLRTEDPVSPWRVSSEPIFRVGWDHSDPAFEDLTSGVVLDGGRVVVAEKYGSGIFYLGPDGAFLAGVGGSGEGPGEYQRIETLIRMLGDSVLVQDAGNYRATVLDPNGGFVRDFRLVSWDGFLGARILGVSRAQQYLLWPTYYNVDGITEPGWVQGALQRWSPGETGTDTIFTAGFASTNGPGDRDPFTPWGFMEGGTEGALYGRTDKAEISWINREGSVFQISRWIPAWRKVDDAVWHGYADAYRAMYPTADPPQLEEALASEREDASETLRLFGFIHSDSEGNAWVGEYEFFMNPPRRYMVILKDGTRSGWVEVPEGLRVLDIGHDRILGIEKNDFDVQAVSVYRIHRD